jgi:flagellum-specific ATP synthase
VSRLNRDLLTPERLNFSAAAREHLAVYRRNQDLINIGAYPAGSNAAIDQAIALREPLMKFLRQGVAEGFTVEQSWSALAKILTAPVPEKTVAVKK